MPLNKWLSENVWAKVIDLPVFHKIMLVRVLMEMKNPTQAKVAYEVRWALHLCGLRIED